MFSSQNAFDAEWYLPDTPKIIRFNKSADLIIPVLELLKDPVAAEIFFSKLRTNKASQPSAHPAVAPMIEEETNTASIHNAHLEKPAQDEIETATTPTHLLASPESADLSTGSAARDERVLSSLSDETRSVKLGALSFRVCCFWIVFAVLFIFWIVPLVEMVSMALLTCVAITTRVRMGVMDPRIIEADSSTTAEPGPSLATSASHTNSSTSDNGIAEPTAEASELPLESTSTPASCGSHG
ncbi:hypothetical protein C0995_006342 [Termitomyces sp. Mi166|nr:hypothetical protein C0995_006342 [Termitomyces sp. Mi166\